MSDDAEIWKPIAGFEGYEISSLGNVRSWKKLRPQDPHPTEPRPVRPSVNSAGYLIVTLHRDGRQNTRSVHRLVLETFVGPVPRTMQACHANGIRTDSRLDNLRWGSVKDNHADALRHGTHQGLKNVGETHPSAKLTEEVVRGIRTMIAAGVTQSAIARSFGISQSTVSRVRSGELWGHV